MTIQDLGSIGELVGAVATVATLIYLAVQIRQNSKVLVQNSQMHATNTYRANIDGVMNLQALLVQDDRLELIWKSGLADEDLSENFTRLALGHGRWLNTPTADRAFKLRSGSKSAGIVHSRYRRRWARARSVAACSG